MTVLQNFHTMHGGIECDGSSKEQDTGHKNDVREDMVEIVRGCMFHALDNLLDSVFAQIIEQVSIME